MLSRIEAIELDISILKLAIRQISEELLIIKEEKNNEKE